MIHGAVYAACRFNPEHIRDLIDNFTQPVCFLLHNCKKIFLLGFMYVF